jgi:hypothetical protein
LIAIVASALLLAGLVPTSVLAGDGATTCHDDGVKGFDSSNIHVDGSWSRGARATIEGQPLALCANTAHHASGSFQWAAIGDKANNEDIVQVGYGHCVYANGAQCNGSFYYFFAWGGHCGGTDIGPTPIRIGAALSNPPASKDFYVIREVIGGVAYYDGYVGGFLLQGLDAVGDIYTARVPASSICWDADSPTRVLDWFGETWDQGDAIGGWDINLVRKHLDYTSMRYSVNTGWLVPPSGVPCTGTPSTIYSCTVVTSDHLYFDTVDR